MRNNLYLRKKLQVRVAIRLLGICIFGCATGFLIFDSPYWMAGIWTSLITVALFLETIRFVIQSEQKLAAFLQALRQNDFAITFSENERSDSYDLHRAFNQLNDIFKRLRSERESQHHLLHAILESSGTPLVCFEEDTGKVYLINLAAKNLFQIPFLQKIDALSRFDAALTTTLKQIKDGTRTMERIKISGKAIVLSIYAQRIIFENKDLKLVSIYDVTSELATKEAETWEKLLRVLTHEISNSAIPLSTLSSYIYEMAERASLEDRKLSDEERSDMMESLRAIEQRSKSLKEFVHNFRQVNQIPEPQLQKVDVLELVKETAQLFMAELDREHITVKVNVSEQSILADRNLTQQVLINLVKNAAEAMSNMKVNKKIEIRSIRNGSRYLHLEVRDFGEGIPPEDLEQIFIPFYSTKKSGSGIGLSISKQIMQKQKGDISVQSEPGMGSTFTLSFRC